MKHNELRSIAHNIAASMASGIGILIGVYELDVFGEAQANPDNCLTIDFLKGHAVSGRVSDKLAAAITKYKEVLPSLCEKQGGTVSEFDELVVRFYFQPMKNWFRVTVRDKTGKQSSTDYEGIDARRTRMRDELGRVRAKPIKRK